MINEKILVNALGYILSCFENIETHPTLSVAAEKHWIDDALVDEDLKSALKNANSILREYKSENVKVAIAPEPMAYEPALEFSDPKDNLRLF